MPHDLEDYLPVIDGEEDNDVSQQQWENEEMWELYDEPEPK